MKRILLCGVLVFSLFSCNKNNIAEIDDPNQAPPVSPVPSVFLQKILLEQFTSSFCGLCPPADTLRDYLHTIYGDRLYFVSIHVGDLMTDTTTTNMFTGVNAIDSVFNPTFTYPSGMLNRQATSLGDLSPAGWESRCTSLISYIPRCGVAIDASITRGIYQDIEVHVGFSDTMAGDYRLHVYLIQSVKQSSDTLYDQWNDLSFYGPTPDSTTSLYNLPYMINRYKHRYVLVRVLTEDVTEGDQIPPSLMHPGGEFIKTYTVRTTLTSLGNLSVIAFVDKYGTSASAHRVENVQQAPLGGSHDWN